MIRIGRTLRTLLPLGPARVLHRALRPVRGTGRRIERRLGASPGRARLRTVPLEPPPRSSAFWSGPLRFRFLEQEYDLGDPADWRIAPSRLWGYHLHYLDALRDAEREPEARLGLLRSWIAGNPFASRPGWEPYPLSLRLVNVLEMLGAQGGAEETVLASLAEQAWWLESNLERDLGANHLLKNGVALAWAGRLLDCRASARWRRKGDAIVSAALRGQVLADGFHYERTPSYHAIFLEDLLRLSALLDATGESGTTLAEQVRGTAAAASRALSSILHADGEIPLFNDSVFEQAPPASLLLEESARCLAGARDRRPDPRGSPAAGLRRLEAVGAVIVLDAGETACREQPGHAHADTLSFELSCGPDRIVVDAGTFGYEASSERTYARSTAAHNTVEVDGLDQSEVWGAFRLGRRARPLDVRGSEPGHVPYLEAAHDGYAHLPGRPVHRRRVEYVGGGTWRVEDRILGVGLHEACGRLRLEPSLEVRASGDGSIRATGTETECEIRGEDSVALRIERGWYFPRWGVKRECAVVRMDARGRLPLRLAYRLAVSRRA